MFIILLCLLSAPLCVNAQVLTAGEAAQRAARFLQQQSPSTAQRIRRHYSDNGQLRLTASRPGVYVFDLVGGGFVIAPTDERIPPVLGYVTEGRFDLGQMPPGMAAWLENYSRAVNSLTADDGAKEAKDTTWQAIAPLVQSRWGQGDPFNRRCPEVDGERCVTGCVATAIAQIMRYYGQPSSCKSIYPYRTQTLKLQMRTLPATEFDWSRMPYVYDNSSTVDQCDEVAKLMLYCGCAFTSN